MYPATLSNQITEGFYYFLVGEINRGTIRNKTVFKVLRKNGSHEYYTYHLTSVM